MDDKVNDKEIKKSENNLEEIGAPKEKSGEKKKAVPKGTGAKKSSGKSVGEISNDEKNIALLSHLSGVLLYFFPGFNILIPLVIFLVKGKEDGFIAHHSRQALFFQFIMTIAMGVFLFLSILLIGIPFFIVLVILHIVYSVLATLAASRGEYYTYPLLDGI